MSVSISAGLSVQVSACPSVSVLICVCLLQGVLAVSDLPLVSMDFKKSDVSTTIDSSLTMVMGDDMVKVSC